MAYRNKLYFFYKQTPQMHEVVSPLLDLVAKHGFQVVSDFNEANIIASIGGDNAFLQAIRKTNFQQDCLYVGISTDHLGFYTDFTIQDQDQMISAIKDEQLEVRKYPIIEVHVDGETPFYCLNECSIRSNIIRTFVLEVYIDQMHFETFRGDGMIISTPTGSTAYNKSVQGAIVDPYLASMQISEIASLNNNEYRTLGNSFILNANRTLTLEVVQDGNDYPIISADNEALGIRHVHRLHTTIADRQIKVLKLKNNSFWNKVQRNFL